ncbi:hypothetical protein HD553DRAFT_364914 [Filobasidium floriforme]|uniref:uncharacterized protein n=1 Tax=Filobasidium floriforme TaxID=5210 RepID=UPI001E8DBDCD|nr:uncharacterized protein HD553DRAFT_364914 [Filobasidium floriforme]KAH8089042.1 hypothetical protein HD553DRAFT_364914 [Filobasidium floriforme]
MSIPPSTSFADTLGTGTDPTVSQPPTSLESNGTQSNEEPMPKDRNGQPLLLKPQQHGQQWVKFKGAMWYESMVQILDQVVKLTKFDDDKVEGEWDQTYGPEFRAALDEFEPAVTALHTNQARWLYRLQNNLVLRQNIAGDLTNSSSNDENTLGKLEIAFEAYCQLISCLDAIEANTDAQTDDTWQKRRTCCHQLCNASKRRLVKIAEIIAPGVLQHGGEHSYEVVFLHDTLPNRGTPSLDGDSETEDGDSD